MKYVFVDLDEVLIHTSALYNEPLSKNLANDYAQATFDGDPCLYVAALRPGAHTLLSRIRQIVPTERVFMLTSSTREYSKKWNEAFGFNFHTIYHREDIKNRYFEPLMASQFPDAEAYHIDNLPRHENNSKVEFLKAIDPYPTYIEVSEYYSSPAHDFTEFEINDIIAHIVAPERKDRRFDNRRW